MIEAYKNRDLDPNKKVQLYRCLNRKGFSFSIRQSGKVIGHTDYIVLKDCTLHVNNSGKIKCIETEERNVHAYVKGFVGELKDIKVAVSFPLMYNPFGEEGFYSFIGDRQVAFKTASVVYIGHGEIKFQL